MITRSIPPSSIKSASVATTTDSPNEPPFLPPHGVVDAASDSFLSSGIQRSSRVRKPVVRLDL